MIDIVKSVKGPVTFTHYFDGSLWYRTCEGDTFPVPIDDIGSATFLSEDKGILFMRYMRSYNKITTKLKENN